MLLIGIGAILVISGVVLMAIRTLRRGRLSDARIDRRRVGRPPRKRAVREGGCVVGRNTARAAGIDRRQTGPRPRHASPRSAPGSSQRQTDEGRIAGAGASVAAMQTGGQCAGDDVHATGRQRPAHPRTTGDLIAAHEKGRETRPFSFPCKRWTQRFIDPKNSSLDLVFFILSSRNSIAAISSIGWRSLRRIQIFWSISGSMSRSSRRVPERLMSIAG